ncbi:hypothetical protein UFOVP1175_19 [uncultured Caudovirales phage]|uniref:Uncharacterized protein n=1 Tax=uncultured Caudovirales phage TaxID=2100421 RepID=A0A6J5R165_9CAUD|nr:hypothetical protein UFOVP1175_19 [uncultured Caudovirales phage]
MSKQTAVDVYHRHIRHLIAMGLKLSEPDKTFLNSAYRDCKAMERGQIEDAYRINPNNEIWSNSGIDYYNETYKGGEQ